MSETRLRGQEVTIRLARGNEVEATITAITDFTAQLDLAILSEGYIGETTMRKDDIYNGTSGGFTVHNESQELFTFVDFLARRAQRLIPVNESTVNAVGRFTFPNGQTPRLLIRDMKFGAIPIAVPSRDAYVNTGFTYETGEVPRFITT
jgi:hypothetical protein